MITFTKEQLIASAHARIEFAEMMLAGELEPLKERTWSIELELARIALASLEAEPVAWISERNLKNLGKSYSVYVKHEPVMVRPIPLYTAPPAPVSVRDEATPENIEILASTFAPRGVTYQWDRDECNAAADSWNSCRAAMLQGAEPVTTAYKLPANTPCKDAPEHIWLQTAGVWPENGEFSELTWCSDNQHPDDTLYVRADVVTGNSPVVPDGLCPCCGRKPLKNKTCSVAGCEGKHVARGFCAMHYAIERKKDPSRLESIRAADKRYRARKAAAPQQEAKP